MAGPYFDRSASDLPAVAGGGLEIGLLPVLDRVGRSSFIVWRQSWKIPGPEPRWGRGKRSFTDGGGVKERQPTLPLLLLRALMALAAWADRPSRRHVAKVTRPKSPENRTLIAPRSPSHAHNPISPSPKSLGTIAHVYAARKLAINFSWSYVFNDRPRRWVTQLPPIRVPLQR